MREMDDVLFQFPELVDYCVRSVGGKKKSQHFLYQITEKNLSEMSAAEKKYSFLWIAEKQNGAIGHCILRNVLFYIEKLLENRTKPIDYQSDFVLFFIL